jgi:hypothetical protein
MILIPKGDNSYTGMEKNLRLITPHKTVQKIFIKTIINRITSILVRKLISTGANTSELPETSLYDML